MIFIKELSSSIFLSIWIISSFILETSSNCNIATLTDDDSWEVTSDIGNNTLLSIKCRIKSIISNKSLNVIHVIAGDDYFVMSIKAERSLFNESRGNLTIKNRADELKVSYSFDRIFTMQISYKKVTYNSEIFDFLTDFDTTMRFNSPISDNLTVFNMSTCNLLPDVVGPRVKTVTPLPLEVPSTFNCSFKTPPSAEISWQGMNVNNLTTNFSLVIYNITTISYSSNEGHFTSSLFTYYIDKAPGISICKLLAVLKCIAYHPHTPHLNETREYHLTGVRYKESSILRPIPNIEYKLIMFWKVPPNFFEKFKSPCNFFDVMTRQVHFMHCNLTDVSLIVNESAENNLQRGGCDLHFGKMGLLPFQLKMAVCGDGYEDDGTGNVCSPCKEGEWSNINTDFKCIDISNRVSCPVNFYRKQTRCERCPENSVANVAVVKLKIMPVSMDLLNINVWYIL